MHSIVLQAYYQNFAEIIWCGESEGEENEEIKKIQWSI